MNDRTWLLKNSTALSCANKCINIIRNEVGTKISLSDKQLLPTIRAMSVIIESSELTACYKQLQKFATPENNLPKVATETLQRNTVDSLQDACRSFIEKIEYKGNHYPRFDAQGREFKGIYRGNANYA